MQACPRKHVARKGHAGERIEYDDRSANRPSCRRVDRRRKQRGKVALPKLLIRVPCRGYVFGSFTPSLVVEGPECAVTAVITRQDHWTAEDRAELVAAQAIFRQPCLSGRGLEIQEVVFGIQPVVP